MYVSDSATVYGEMVALRLLDKSRVNLSLTELGFMPDSLKIYDECESPYGMILSAAPPGPVKPLPSMLQSISSTIKHKISSLSKTL